MERPHQRWITPIWVDDPPEVIAGSGIRAEVAVDDQGGQIVAIIDRNLHIDRILELLAAAGSENLSEHYQQVGAPRQPIRMEITRWPDIARPCIWRESEGLVHLQVHADLDKYEAVEAMCLEAERVMGERWIRVPDPPPPQPFGVPG